MRKKFAPDLPLISKANFALITTANQMANKVLYSKPRLQCTSRPFHTENLPQDDQCCKCQLVH